MYMICTRAHVVAGCGHLLGQAEVSHMQRERALLEERLAGSQRECQALERDLHHKVWPISFINTF